MDRETLIALLEQDEELRKVIEDIIKEWITDNLIINIDTHQERVMESIPQNIVAAVNKLAESREQIDLVNHIESDVIPTTQNSYGRYMNAIATLSDGTKGYDLIVALALIKAGANRQGVLSAINVNHGQLFQEREYERYWKYCCTISMVGRHMGCHRNSRLFDGSNLRWIY